jgi:hypothetical protein
VCVCVCVRVCARDRLRCATRTPPSLCVFVCATGAGVYESNSLCVSVSLVHCVDDNAAPLLDTFFTHKLVDNRIVIGSRAREREIVLESRSIRGLVAFGHRLVHSW